MITDAKVAITMKTSWLNASCSVGSRVSIAPWKDAKPEAMKMITETAAMTDEEMKMEGIEPDPCLQ